MTDREPGHVLGRADFVVCLLLTLAAAIVFGRDITVGGFRFPDTSVHGMDGVLIHDFVSAGPEAWSNPKDFALQQYAHYPSLGMVGVYPPGFALVESVFFAVFGISVFSARLCTLTFGLVAVVGCYLFARRAGSRWVAAFATGALIAIPGIVFWSRQAMLEMPTLAVLIWLLYVVDCYFRRPTWPRLLFVCGLAMAAPMFKQNAIFIVPVLGLLATVKLWQGRMPRAHFLAALPIIGLPLGAYYMWALFVEGSANHAKLVLTEGRSFADWLSLSPLLSQLEMLPRWVGWPVLAPAALGLLISLGRRDWRWGMVLAWFAVFLVMTIALQHSGLEARYFYFGYLPLAMWAGLGAATVLGLIRLPRVRGVIGVVLIVTALLLGYRTPIEYRPDHGQVVCTYADQMGHRLVLFEGRQDGGFIFATRRLLGPRQCVVVRGSKLFYSCFTAPRYDFKSHVASREDVAQTIEEFGFDLFFVERQNMFGLKEVAYLHEELADPQRYERIGTHTLTVPAAGGDGHAITVDVFRPRFATQHRVRQLDIPVAMIGRSVRVDFDTLTLESDETPAGEAARLDP